ncbi:MAG: hypothetical protein QM478_01805 [Flavobacteriaceae bacterium]
MKKIFLSFFFLFHFLHFFGQDNNIYKKTGISFKVQGVALFLYDSDAFDYFEGSTNFNRESINIREETSYELAENSRIFGINGEVNYYFNPQIALGGWFRL